MQVDTDRGTEIGQGHHAVRIRRGTSYVMEGERDGIKKMSKRGSANGGQTISEAPALIDTESARTEYVKGRSAVTRCLCDAFHNDTIYSGEEWFCKGQLECHEGGQEVADGEQCYKFGLRMRRFVFCRPYIFTMIIHPSRAE